MSTPSNVIIQGNCLDILPQIDARSVDFILTDPPYIARYRSRDGRSVQNDDNAAWLAPSFAEMYRVLKNDAETFASFVVVNVGIQAVQVDGPAGGLEQRGEDLDGGGFAGAVRAEESENFALLHIEGDVVDGPELLPAERRRVFLMPAQAADHFLGHRGKEIAQRVMLLAAGELLGNMVEFNYRVRHCIMLNRESVVRSQ